MIKALLKKQILGVASVFLLNKDGKRRSNAALLGFAVLMVYGFGAMGAMFWLMSSALCEPLVMAGLDWVYFAFMSVLATCFGVIGGVFTAKSKLYEAKDNDLLLSLPIPAWMILCFRMLGLYVFTFFFEALVFVPSVAYYLINIEFSFAVLALCILIQLIMPLGALAICCLLGFLLAWVTARIPFKNLFTIIGFSVFMVLYFTVYTKINEYLGYVIANGEAVGATMKTALYPFAKLGFAATGSGVDFLLFALIFLGLFALVYAILSVTYLKIATMKRGERFGKYKEKKQKSQPPIFALCKREFLRIFKSAAYLLNASMGTLMMIIVSVMAVIKGDLFGIDSTMIAAMPALSENIGLIGVAMICFVVSSNFVAAVSVTLEGNSLWVVKSLPIPTHLVLDAKWYVHFLFTAVPAVIFSVIVGLVVELSWGWVLAMVAMAIIASATFAVMDLAVNLKFPNLHWTNETAAIKQGISTVIAMFGGWGIALLPIFGWFLFGKYLPAWGYYCIGLAYFLAIGIGFWLWLRKRGVKIFEELSV